MMSRRPMAWGGVSGGIHGCVQDGCSGTGVLACGLRPQRRPDGGQPRRRRRRGALKLAVLPVDTDAFPRDRASLNGALHDVKVKGVDDYFLSKVTLEVVQLSIECVQPTSECYSAVGNSLSANKLLLGHHRRRACRRRNRASRRKKNVDSRCA